VIPARAPAPPELATAAAVSAASAALAWLRSGRPGRVLHVFDRAAYLTDARGGMLLLAAPPLAMGPFTLLTDLPNTAFSEYMDVDDPALIRQGRFCVGRISIRIDTATPWRASPDWGAVRRGAAAWAACLPSIRQVLRQHGRQGVFAGFIDGVSPKDEPTIDGQLARRAWGAADELLDALGGEDDNRLTRAAADLAGLGQGFTPSGDDYLMGTMYALWAIRPARTARRLCRLLAEVSAPRTTPASAAWLQAAARGEAAEPWHRLIDSLAGGTIDELQTAARRILQTGHTSGEDALSGFVLSTEAIHAGSSPR
jgi:hypothetical protein